MCADAVIAVIAVIATTTTTRDLMETGVPPRRLIGKRRCGALVLALVVGVCDQASKAWALQQLPLEGLRLSFFLNLVRVENHGIAFGLFNDARPLQALFLAGLALGIALLVLGLPFFYRQKWGFAPAGLLIGGALGNAGDRLRHGAVIDFLDFHWGSWHWPAFNLADAAVCVAVIGLLPIWGGPRGRS